jgi:hypothetical protein
MISIKSVFEENAQTKRSDFVYLCRQEHVERIMMPYNANDSNLSAHDTTVYSTISEPCVSMSMSMSMSEPCISNRWLSEQSVPEHCSPDNVKDIHNNDNEEYPIEFSDNTNRNTHMNVNERFTDIGFTPHRKKINDQQFVTKRKQPPTKRIKLDITQTGARNRASGGINIPTRSRSTGYIGPISRNNKMTRYKISKKKNRNTLFKSLLSGLVDSEKMQDIIANVILSLCGSGIKSNRNRLIR